MWYIIEYSPNDNIKVLAENEEECLKLAEKFSGDRPYNTVKINTFEDYTLMKEGKKSNYSNKIKLF